ncbi:type VII secretion integral membrane protein EccD [Micromonospora sp. NPDC003197]
MATDPDVGLTRVVVVAPQRRLDLALPEQLALAVLLPAMLSHAGEEVVDRAGEQGGWVLRRRDGTRLDVARSVAAQGVRDGEVLHLVQAHTDWPEPEYDDIVEAIAAGARQGGALWDARVSRWGGAVIAGVLVFAALLVSLLSGPPWTPAAGCALGMAVVLLTSGAVLSRQYDEPEIGRLLAGYGLVAAFTGGLLLLGGTQPLSRFGAPHLLTGCAALLLAGLAGYLGETGQRWLFVAAMTAALTGAGGAAVALGPFDAVGTAATTGAALLLLAPLWPALAARLGRLPLPSVPRSATDLLSVERATPAAATLAAVTRADDILTGFLAGTAVVAAIGLVLLGPAGGVAAPLLTLVLAVAYLLRARLFPTVRHRLPMLACGLIGLVALAVGQASTMADPGSAWYAVALGGAALGAVAVGLRTANRRPSVYLARAADLLDVLLLLAVVPLACGVLGLYAAMRGVAG